MERGRTAGNDEEEGAAPLAGRGYGDERRDAGGMMGMKNVPSPTGAEALPARPWPRLSKTASRLVNNLLCRVSFAKTTLTMPAKWGIIYTYNWVL